MLNIPLLTLLFVTHWVGDYICQPRDIAEAKYKDLWALLVHVCIYTIIFLPFLLFFSPGFVVGYKFLVLLGISHFVIDFFTSKATHMYYEQKDFHMFFITLGADQLLHILTIFVLLNWYIL